MLFNSWQFLAFFLVVATLYFCLAQRWRWALLLAASYYFYACSGPAFAVLLAISTVVDYGAALGIAASTTRRGRVGFLLLSLVANLGMLGYFKYFHFFATSAGSVAAWWGWQPTGTLADIVLPVGISFYTFQTLSYTIDVYRGEQPPERHLGYFALYVSFFPQLVAGPIERSTTLLGQLRQRHDFDYDRVRHGLQIMAWGLLKKIVVADQLAVAVNAVYNDPTGLSGLHYVGATIFFAFQIYCDFSGYSDVAIGSAQVLGVRLMTNFDRPYASRSLREFWSRWHISLSTWFRDYVYVPLGGNRVSVPRWYVNLLIVFAVSGLWHGAKWTFVLWGLLHGGLLVAGLMTASWRQRLSQAIGLDRVPALRDALSTLAVFGLVCFTWIFFRANSVDDAWYIVSRLGVGWENLFTPGWLREARIQAGVSERYLALSGLSVLGLLAIESWTARGSDWKWLTTKHWSLRWAVYVTVALLIGNLGAPKAQPFIYFQF